MKVGLNTTTLLFLLLPCLMTSMYGASVQQRTDAAVGSFAHRQTVTTGVESQVKLEKHHEKHQHPVGEVPQINLTQLTDDSSTTTPSGEAILVSEVTESLPAQMLSFPTNVEEASTSMEAGFPVTEKLSTTPTTMPFRKCKFHKKDGLGRRYNKKNSNYEDINGDEEVEKKMGDCKDGFYDGDEGWKMDVEAEDRSDDFRDGDWEMNKKMGHHMDDSYSDDWTMKHREGGSRGDDRMMKHREDGSHDDDWMMKHREDGSHDDDWMMKHRKDSSRGDDKMMEHRGDDRMVKHRGDDKMMEHRSYDKMMERRGDDRMMKHRKDGSHGDDWMMKHRKDSSRDDDRMMKHREDGSHDDDWMMKHRKDGSRDVDRMMKHREDGSHDDDWMMKHRGDDWMVKHRKDGSRDDDRMVEHREDGSHDDDWMMRHRKGGSRDEDWKMNKKMKHHKYDSHEDDDDDDDNDREWRRESDRHHSHYKRYDDMIKHEARKHHMKVKEHAMEKKCNRVDSKACGYLVQETADMIVDETSLDEPKSTQAPEMSAGDAVGDVVTTTNSSLNERGSGNTGETNTGKETTREMSTDEQKFTSTTTEMTTGTSTESVMDIAMSDDNNHFKSTCKSEAKCYSDEDCNGGKCNGMFAGFCKCRACNSFRKCTDDRACGGLKGACDMKLNRCDCLAVYKTFGYGGYGLPEFCSTKICNGTSDTCHGLPCMSGRCSC